MEGQLHNYIRIFFLFASKFLKEKEAIAVRHYIY